MTLDAQGDPGAVVIFQAGSTLITASDSRVAPVRGAQACNVFWQVGSSATLGTNTTFVGTIVALTPVTVQAGTRVAGRVLARNGQVSLDTKVYASHGGRSLQLVTCGGQFDYRARSYLSNVVVYTEPIPPAGGVALR